MSEHTTRIADLPENITVQMPPDGRQTAPAYAPMNVHPNPYGNSVQPAVMSLPQQLDMSQRAPPVRLPSRDIPMNSGTHQQDEEVHANYIPKVKMSGDYVKEYENLTDTNIRKHEASKRSHSKIDYLITTLQVPITIAILFFFFHMPIVNTMFFKNFAFLSIYNGDGNINFYGIAIKSMLFGALFYFIQNSIDYLGDL